MEELILYIVKSIVSKPDEVTVEDGGTREGATVYNLKVADEDKGFVIGKQGRVAKALRAIVKAAAAKEYAARKGIVDEEDEEESCMSGIPSRPFCKGRNYDPNRYSATEE